MGRRRAGTRGALPDEEDPLGAKMRNFGLSAAAIGAALLAFSSGAGAQAPPADPPKPWYEAKIIPDPFSMTVAFWSNYRFRGISQTSNAPGYNGSFDFEMDLFKDFSVYAGVWASNINFNGGFRPRVEVDVYGGVKGKLFEKLSWNVQLIGYLYPGAPGGSNLDYFEVMPSLGWDFGFMEITGGVALSPNYTADSGFSAWVFGDVTVPIPVAALEPYKVALFGHIGYQSIERNENFGTPDYLEWEIGVKWELYGFKMSVKYGDTNLSRSECFGGQSWCRATAVFVVSKTF
jgi:uncharacterized protein (TIGR02001 family)